MPPSPVLVLHDGLAGHRRQGLALARALDPAAVEQALALPAPWAWAAPRRLPGAAAAFGPAFARVLAAPPPLAVGVGRRAALATRLLRARGTRVVQVLDPRLDPAHWDLVVAPEHDGLHGDNVITLCGSLHPVDAAWLAAARAATPAFAALPGPRIALLLGGPTRAVRFDRGAFEVMAARLERWIAAGQVGSLMVLGSRRTPPALAAIARARWPELPGPRWFTEADGANPYDTALAWADAIIASPDSVNMVSEACATTAPVFVPEPARATGRVRRFLEALQERGRIRAMGPSLEVFEATPLRETARVADLVRARLAD